MDMDSLNTIISMHIKECDSRDARTAEAFKEIKIMFKGLWDAHDEMRKIVTNLQIKAALVLGGLMVLGKILDYFFVMHKG